MNLHIPQLTIVVTLSAGIACGRTILTNIEFVNSTLWWLTHPATLSAITIVFSIITLFIIYHRIAIVTLIATVFFLGMFVIRNHDLTSRPITDTIIPAKVDSIMSEQRLRLSNIYLRHGLNGDRYAIVTAMTLGDRGYISHHIKEIYNTTSASHVLALSGLHISILFMFISTLLPRYFPCGLQTVILFILIWLYVLLVGSPPSASRAAVMISIYMLMKLLSRRTDGLASLCATAFLLLSIKPSWLFNIGFQMSFMAVLGIVLFYRALYRPEFFILKADPWHKVPLKEKMQNFNAANIRTYMYTGLLKVAGWVWSTLSLSIAAQMTVAPIIAYYFHRTSIWFLLSSLIVSPCALIIIPLAFILLLIGLLSEFIPFLAPFATFIATLLSSIVEIQNTCIERIATFPSI